MRNLTLQELRLEKKMTQENVAEKTGFSKDYISMVERGTRNLSDNAKAKFAEVYNVSIVQIFLSLQRTKSAIKGED